MLNFTPEVLVNGKWLGSDSVYATKLEAQEAAYEIMYGWSLVTDYRAVPTDLPVNCPTPPALQKGTE